MADGVGPALIGLLGVGVGAVLTYVRELVTHGQRERQSRTFLAIQVGAALERYASACADVANDDGSYPGQPDDEFRKATVQRPTFDPEQLKVEWRTLNPPLMYAVLDLPRRAEIADRAIEIVGEFDDEAPEFGAFFQERQYQYAMLGIRAWEQAQLLRELVGLPPRTADEWSPMPELLKGKAWVEERRAAVEAHRNTVYPLPPLPPLPPSPET